ncbi:hypothetical protein [Pseudonocardia charpentierae]|uniref:Uncharacterized protein n=1 Tax=Pseudonocardia charpentierae TaxID=3075545 RepID=A0ABU2N2N7_9PSEU|nr:hypothetical protein [Pseudonocardia sp. DSM 45834]MDT0348176.1 hypothetical protein [Pseudonocardia sp. DSM 45834]
MLPSRWTLHHYGALLDVVCAVAVAIGTVVLGASAPTLRDAAFPLLLGVCVVAVLVRWAVRSWRDGGRKAERVASPPPRSPADPPRLSPEGERELTRIVAVLAAAGVFAPRAPDPADLHGPVADQGEPITVEGVLAALDEADYYVPGFDAAAYSANLAFHVSHGEQLAEVLREQVGDLVRLGGGRLADVTAAVDLTYRPGTARVRTVIRLVVDEAEQVLAYDGAAKYLSTEVHVALARILRERGMDRRLAWLWSDQGVWLSGLPDGAVDGLNTALGAAAGEGWQWVDEQEPVAAGEMYEP